MTTAWSWRASGRMVNGKVRVRRTQKHQVYIKIHIQIVYRLFVFIFCKVITAYICTYMLIHFRKCWIFFAFVGDLPKRRCDDLNSTRFTRNKTKVVIVTNFIYQPPSNTKDDNWWHANAIYCSTCDTIPFNWTNCCRHNQNKPIKNALRRVVYLYLHMHCTLYWQALL